MLPYKPAAAGRIDWIASYPKSGNTWLRMLLTAYFAERDEPLDINGEQITRGIASARRLFEGALGVTCDDLLPHEALALRPWVYRVLAARHADGLWLKVHDRQAAAEGTEPLFPADASGSAIYLVRNPLDVAVSNAFHDGHGDMARAVDKLCDPDMVIGGGGGDQLPQRLGDWSMHVLSWIEQSQIRVLTVRYEDMLADPGAVLARVIGFARPQVAIYDDRIAHAVAQTRFERLQSAEAGRRFRERPRSAERFFRQGNAGDWRRHLSAAQVARLCAQHGAVMRRFGYAPDEIQEGIAC